MERTWTITDADGNPRTVTLAQFRAELDARAAMCRPIKAAFMRNDKQGVADAQAAMRAVYPK